MRQATWVRACALKVCEWGRSSQKGTGPAFRHGMGAHMCIKSAADTLEGRQGSRMVDMPIPPAK